MADVDFKPSKAEEHISKPSDSAVSNAQNEVNAARNTENAKVDSAKQSENMTKGANPILPAFDMSDFKAPAGSSASSAEKASANKPGSDSATTLPKGAEKPSDNVNKPAEDKQQEKANNTNDNSQKVNSQDKAQDKTSNPATQNSDGSSQSKSDSKNDSTAPPSAGNDSQSKDSSVSGEKQQIGSSHAGPGSAAPKKSEASDASKSSGAGQSQAFDVPSTSASTSTLSHR